MPILLDYQLKELIPHKATAFPVTYYHDELAELSPWTGPFHWHPDFEIATAKKYLRLSNWPTAHYIRSWGQYIY